MSNQPDRLWSEDEKYALLAEILKSAGIPSSYLVRIIHEYRINPNWDNIPLPAGRSLNSCRVAFNHMVQPNATASGSGSGSGSANATGLPPPPPPPQPQQPQPAPILTSSAAASASRSNQQLPHQSHQPNHPPQPPHLQDIRKRPLDSAHSHTKAQAPRAIQPKPPASNASYSSKSPAPLSPRWSSIGPGGEPPRKRGRPSKAETERRRAAAQARGETYPPPRRSASRARPIGVFGVNIPPSPTSPGSVSGSASASALAPIHAPASASTPSSASAPPSAAGSTAMGGYGHTPSSAPPPGLLPASVPYDFQVTRGMPSVGTGVGVGVGIGAASASSPASIHGSASASGPHVPRSSRAMSLRELPRPSEMGHPSLPSPHTLQLGPGPMEPFRPRINSAGDRMFMGGPIHALSSPGPGSISGPSDRFSPGRRDSVASSGAGAGGRDREMGPGSAGGSGGGGAPGYSDLRNSSTPGEPR